MPLQVVIPSKLLNRNAMWSGFLHSFSNLKLPSSQWCAPPSRSAGPCPKPRCRASPKTVAGTISNHHLSNKAWCLHETSEVLISDPSQSGIETQKTRLHKQPAGRFQIQAIDNDVRIFVAQISDNPHELDVRKNIWAAQIIQFLTFGKSHQALTLLVRAV